MDLYKITHDAYEVTKHWHIPLFAAMFGQIGVTRIILQNNFSDLGEVPGDNILPKEILISLSSRGGL